MLAQEKIVSQEETKVAVRGLSDTAKKVLQVVNRSRDHRHMTKKEIARTGEMQAKNVGYAVNQLVELGILVEQLHDDDEEPTYRMNAPAAAPAAPSIIPTVHVPDGREEDDPELLEPAELPTDQPSAAPDVAEVLKRFETGANEIRKMGWGVIIQVKLSFPESLKEGS